MNYEEITPCVCGERPHILVDILGIRIYCGRKECKHKGLSTNYHKTLNDSIGAWEDVVQPFQQTKSKTL